MKTKLNIILKGNPVSTGTIYQVACRGKFASYYVTKRGKEIKASYIKQITEQYDGEILTGGLKLDVELFFGTKRKADVDNFNKLLLDAFTGIVWVDDVQIQELNIKKNYCKEDPRIEVKIELLNE